MFYPPRTHIFCFAPSKSGQVPPLDEVDDCDGRLDYMNVLPMVAYYPSGTTQAGADTLQLIRVKRIYNF